MKKSVLVLLMSLISMAVPAGRTPKGGATPVKKVAILEIVDKTNQVSYAHKLMLRTSLTKAITEAEGYEGYDRTDLDALLGEQTFQRTGMVTGEQIKRVGEMTGAQYVLVAEAVMVDSVTIFATSKIIDVETAETIKAESQLMRATPQDIQVGCTTLACNMLGVTLEAGITQAVTTPKPAVTTSPAPATTSPTPAAKPAAQSYPKPTVTWDWADNCTVSVKRCYVENGRLYIDLRFTNKGDTDFKYYFSSIYIKVYDSEGGYYEGKSSLQNTILWVRGKQATIANDAIPSGITIPVVYAIKDFNTAAESVSLCEIRVDHGTIYGNYRSCKLKIKNMHIEK